MAEIQSKHVTEYRKFDGRLVKVLPETVGGNVIIGSYGTQSNLPLSDVLADIESKLGNLISRDALEFCGVVDATHALPTDDYKIGDVYRVGGTSTIVIDGYKCEPGDLITCVATDNAGTSGTYTEASPNTDWLVTQANIDGAVVGPASATVNNLAAFNNSNGKVVKDSGLSITSVTNAVNHIDDVANGTTQGHVTLSDTGDASKDASSGYAATPKAVAAVEARATALEGRVYTIYSTTAPASDQPSGDFANLVDGGEYIHIKSNS